MSEYLQDLSPPLYLQIMEALSPKSGQLRILHTTWLALHWSLEQLPLHVQQQIVSAFFHFKQKYNLRVTQQSCSKQDPSMCLSGVASEANPTLHKDVKNIPQPNSNWRASENWSNPVRKRSGQHWRVSLSGLCTSTVCVNKSTWRLSRLIQMYSRTAPVNHTLICT